jgi:methylenetetrahydrofolate reductase (NADPH)
MKIKDILQQDKVTISFEVFPPKKADGLEKVEKATEQIAALRPDFMSVTYGAGGSTSKMTLEIASNLQQKYGVSVLPHLTCVASSKSYVRDIVAQIKALGIENIMALRGDIPQDGFVSTDYKYASDLIRDIKEQSDLCIGGACYPEGHIECKHKEDDIIHLKEKVEAGCDFLTTQMFFDNNILYNFLYRIREKGITVPVLAGIMPITNAKQLERSIALSGTHVPQRFRAIVDKFGDNPEAMKQAGIVYAAGQIIDLIANDITHIHVYSMNKPEVAAGILNNLSSVLR